MNVAFVGSENELLGIEYLSAALKRRGHSTFLSIDPRLFGTELSYSKTAAGLFSNKNRVVSDVAAGSPGLICFSVCSDNLSWALDLAAACKEACGVPVVFGGIAPTVSPGQVLSHESVDYACVGEGEEALADLADALDAGRDTTVIPNIWARRNGGIHENNPRPLVEDLDTIPFPDKELWLPRVSALYGRV